MKNMKTLSIQLIMRNNKLYVKLDLNFDLKNKNYQNE